MRIAKLAATALLSFTAFQSASAEETAIFAGGCFWCIEKDFEHVTGVTAVQSGYTGGTLENPTYQQVSKENTGHYEAVEIKYDEKVVSYQQLIEIFFRSVDPTDPGGQFCDRGDSYRTAIFSLDENQMQHAVTGKRKAATDLNQHVATIIQPASTFYPAEDYHQDYYKKNKLKYNFYRFRCGRNATVEKLWGKAAYVGISDH